MPKVRASRQEQSNRGIIAVISKYIALRGSSKDKLMAVMGISRTALYDRWKNPDLFRLGEIRAIYDHLHVPDEEREGLKGGSA